MNILAIDQGTSATKALVVSADGSVSPRPGPGPSARRRRRRGRAGPAGAVDSIVTAGRQALDDAGDEVGAVGVANQGETVLRWDPATGRPLGPAISWQDRRAAEVTERLAEHEERLVELTGLPLDPYFAAPKMTWLRRHDGATGAVTTVTPGSTTG